MRGCDRLRSSISCVFMDSKGVTATRDSVAPAANPANTVAGPAGMDVSARRDLYVSKATNPVSGRTRKS